MTEATIRPAEADDVAALDAGLRALSEGMGDAHRAGPAELRAAGFGPNPAFHALLAERSGAVAGVVLVSPVFSTVRGAAGAFVSDLWVDPVLRGAGLGGRLLAAAHDSAERHWGAAFLRLAVYDDNPRARAFYERLGFAPQPGEIILTLDARGLAALKGAT